MGLSVRSCRPLFFFYFPNDCAAVIRLGPINSSCHLLRSKSMIHISPSNRLATLNSQATYVHQVRARCMIIGKQGSTIGQASSSHNLIDLTTPWDGQTKPIIDTNDRQVRRNALLFQVSKSAFMTPHAQEYESSKRRLLSVIIGT